jgi:hypothetical protein
MNMQVPVTGDFVLQAINLHEDYNRYSSSIGCIFHK